VPLRWLIIAVASLSCGLLSASGWAGDRIDEFNKARRTLQPQLRSKQPAARASAVSQLQAFPIAESVRLIYNVLNDSDSKVREAAYSALLKMSGNQEVCDTLLLLAKKNLHRDESGETAVPALAALLSSNLPSVRRDSLEFVDGTVARSKNGSLMLVTLADELGAHRASADVVPLSRLAKTKAFEAQFGIRRAVVGALSRIPAPEALGMLIEIMDKVGGEAKADAVEHLSQVTGQIFGMEAPAWARWWEDVKDTYEYPARSIETPYRSVALESQSGYYYGLPLFAQRVVFVLDTSGSMIGPRIAAAKRELMQAIGGLPDHVHFGVVVFNGTVAVWHKQLLKASDENKHAALHYVDAQVAQSNTASYDALETALGFDTEAIYFLSDGAPHGGKITAPVDIVEAITQANRSRRVSIYTIGIGAGIPGGPLDLFLKTLAEQNLGLYRRVDG
jgi:von Willebrand factor type A domain